MGEYTRESYDRLRKQVARLRDMHRSALSLIGEAAEADSNTWHDNAAFDEANRNEQLLRLQLKNAEALLREATVVDSASSDARGGQVVVGSTVTYRFVGDSEYGVAVIAGRHVIRSEDDEHHHMSTEAPLGKALMGASAGETVSYVAPNGQKLEVEVIAVA